MSLILRTITRFMLPLLQLFSLVLLLRGHHQPGGGFAGGLVAAAAVTLFAIAYHAQASRRVLRVEPHLVVAAGLALVLASALAGPLAGKPLLTGLWLPVDVPGMGGMSIGTPVLFDVGVYLAVLGATMTMILSLAER